MPNCNETPADTKRMQTKFEYSAEGTNNAAKIPHQMPLFTKQHENINTSKERLKKKTQNIALSQTKRKDKPKQIQNRIRNKYCYTSQSKLKHAWTYTIASAACGRSKWTFEFYNAKHLYHREKQRLLGRTWIMAPPHDMTHIWQRRPLQQKCRRSSKFRR